MGLKMSDEIKNVTEQKTRRSAIKTAAQVAVTAPAVGLLLNASTKAASAAIHYGDLGGPNDNAYVTTTPIDDAGSDNNKTVIVGGDDTYTY